MLVSLVLYGSRARGDHRLSSDVDLLGVVEGGPIRTEVVARGASLYQYPAPTLLAKAREGDLFVLHLISEGKLLHDSLDFFDNVRKSFAFKKSYAPIIKQGHAIARFIESHPSFLQSKKVRKRYIWAIRTILIARCAENGNACFSSSSLSKFAEIPELKSIIDSRYTIPPIKMIGVGAEIVTQFGIAGFDQTWSTNSEFQVEYLKSLGGIAESTLSLVQRKRSRSNVSDFGGTYE